ncbi:hypothetical protein UY3_00002, partial [Chelonia mydas]
WTLWLAPCLTSRAQAAYIALSEHQARGYETLKAAILDRRGLSVEKNCQKFRAASWSGGICPRAFAQKLSDWATQWFRLDSQNIKTVTNSIFPEQFIQRLPEARGIWVWRHLLELSEVAVKLTEEYV